jgi:hypothetical protein
MRNFKTQHCPFVTWVDSTAQWSSILVIYLHISSHSSPVTTHTLFFVLHKFTVLHEVKKGTFVTVLNYEQRHEDGGGGGG